MENQSDNGESSDSDMEDVVVAENSGLQTEPNLQPAPSDSEGEDDPDLPVTFVIDKSAAPSGSRPTYSYGGGHDDDDDDDDDSDSDESEPEQQTTDVKNKNSLELSSSLQSGIDTSKLIYMNTDIFAPPKLKNQNITDLLLNPKGSELLKKSVLTSDMEKKNEMIPYQQSVRKIKKQRREEKAKCKGDGWFNMKAPEMTEEKKNDLMIMSMRRSLNPKQFYKAPDIKGLPKYFEMGTVVDSPVDFYRDRIPKKQRKQTLVDELLADAQLRKYNKRKYTEIMESKMRKGRGAHKHMKRLKKRKK